MTSLTSDLSETIADLARGPLPPPIEDVARRTFANVVGTAVGASRSAAVDSVVAAASAHGSSGDCLVPGRAERLDLYTAALAIGVSAHLDDFDDTHLRTVIHPGASCLGTVLPIAAASTGTHAPARELVAFALGCEVQLRLGNAVSPSHYDRGWHITGTCGVVGAAVCAGVLWGLDADGLEAAIGLAANATVGQREAFGSMAKSFHAGKAAEQGLLAAALAQAGQRARPGALDDEGGFLDVLAETSDPRELVADLGDRWELELNTFKPYPCGIVSHPVIDAALAAADHIPDAGRISRIRVRCNPLVPELMGNMDPRDGLQGRFSAAHTAAAALADRELGLDQFDDDRVRGEDLVCLRAALSFDVDPDCRRDEAEIEVHLADGVVVREHVEHARGSLERPLSDAELEAKVTKLVERALPGSGEAVWAAAGRIATDGVTPLIDVLSSAARATSTTTEVMA